MGVPGQLIVAYSVEDDEAGVAHHNGCAVLVTDGPIPYGPRPITHVVDCTLGAATALTWTSAVPGLTDQLPAGVYKLWGADFVCTDGIACRFIIPGVDHRPGVFARRNEDDPMHPFNACFNPAGYDIVHKGGTLNITAEYLAYSAATPSTLQLYMQKVG